MSTTEANVAAGATTDAPAQTTGTTPETSAPAEANTTTGPKKTLLLVAYWKPKGDGGRTNHFDLKTSESVPKKTAENAKAVGITFADKADVTDEHLLTKSYTKAKTATDKAKAAGFDVITSQAVALKYKKLNAPAAPTQAPADQSSPASPVIETSAPVPIEAQPGETATLTGDGTGQALPPIQADAEAVPQEHTVVYDTESQGGSLPVE